VCSTKRLKVKSYVLLPVLAAMPFSKGVTPKRAEVLGEIDPMTDRKGVTGDRGMDTSCPVPTGWPEVVTHLRLPQNGACRFTALRSSKVDSQYGDSLQLPVGEIQLWLQ
jgi:hypothetical protein